MNTRQVDVTTFARAETDLMLSRLLAQSGGVNRWFHHRTPTPLDDQPVIRLNRDTLYSFVVADISGGATLTLPDAGRRYLSAMVVDRDHYVTAVLHEPGEHALSADRHGTDVVLVGVRTLVDPDDAADVAHVAALQDRLGFTAASSRPFGAPDWDRASQDRTREALLALQRDLDGLDHAFGTRQEVDPVRHLLGTAAGWGGLPSTEATYLNAEPRLPLGSYELTVPADVPVDGFWSISLYDAHGYFPTGTGGAVSLNSITAARDADGSVTLRFGGEPGRPNQLPLVDGWNYLVRLYRPRPAVLDGSWTFPELRATTG
ncbi:hypothetical protein CHO01_01790 [Cellulomonas hominis]|uniref:Carboxylesterase n=1 Tax=Cellulomonas hominis TaxID=156981 RepID=A0A511F792_9CELL|nr:DUF1214 domain-containing protein [Cellulomonas hominis]MBB5474144.1 hypothetical protein [Cellulomonas hominis]NKY05679.1 DUF1214 domain-containing protein [Cellulomonas hominis]GEL45063.1 hypothetical protein CHO01_01790 [Cellulomonas hominis]